MSDILKIAEQLNSEVTRLNNERSKLEGMLESAKTNYEKAVKAYEVKYGVKLTTENLQSEYNDVFAKTKGSVLDLQEKIESIKRGDYKTNSAVSYDLEPNVEPIRAKVESKKVEKVSEPVLAEPEEIEDVAVEEVTVEIPKGPLDLDFNFSGFGDTTTVSSPVAEVAPTVAEPVVSEPIVSEPVVAKETPKAKGKGKPLSGADLSAALKAAETIKQTPVTIPGMSVENDEDDEVPLDNLGFDMSFGSKPAEVEIPKDTAFGEFSFGSMVNEPVVDAPLVHTPDKKDEPVVDGFGDFGGFGDMSGFGGFGVAETTEKVVDAVVEDAIPESDNATFGGLNTSEPSTKSDVAETPITPEGWGSDAGFNFGTGFDDIFKTENVKFGQ